jgi:FMN phosphatase YigB (HAD superfamily)
LEKFFSIKVISEGGKRDGSAFREWIAKSKCEPSELLYVGNDLERDVETPSKLGINAVHLNQGRNVKARPSYSEIESFGELLELCGVGK